MRRFINLNAKEVYFTSVSLSKLEIIFCVFLTENYFVNALIPFIGVRGLGYIMPRQYDQRDIERLDVILWSWA